MSNNYFKIFSLIFLTTFLFSNIFIVVSALAAAEWQPPDIQIQFPEKIFKTQVTCTDNTDGTKTCRVPWMAEYISAIYKYAVGIVGIIAVVVMMLGGVIWMTAGGNAGRVTEAKSWITAALTGLVLVLASYTILYTVNPDLVNLKFINIKTVKMINSAPGCKFVANEGEAAAAICSNSETQVALEKCGIKSNTVLPNPGICCCSPSAALAVTLDRSMCIAPYLCTDCDNCVDASSVGIPCKQTNTSCYLNTDLVAKLSSLRSLDPNWQITEGWPPHANHGVSSGHQNGNSADISVTNGVTPANIKNLYNNLASAGFSSYQIEAESCSDYAGFKCATLSQTGGTGVHIHINK